MKMRNFDPELDAQINIGYPLQANTVGRNEKRKQMKTLMTPEMERKTRLGEGNSLQDNTLSICSFMGITHISEKVSRCY